MSTVYDQDFDRWEAELHPAFNEPEYGHEVTMWDKADKWLYRVTIGLGIVFVALVVWKW